MIDGLRNSMFGPAGAGGLDLLSINIQRGRDHGLPVFTELQELVGLTPATTFSDITSDPQLQSALQTIYGSVDEVDSWIGALAEDPVHDGSALGPTLQIVITDQFENLMVGDRFFHLWDEELTAGDLDLIQSSTLAEVISRNTNVTGLQANVFFVPEPTSAMMCLMLLGLLAGRAGGGMRE